ncbi:MULTISPECIES: hypothetical protein [unclassified Bradyrhizobium]|uniref:hypothetical protein n=1 Tax=unclassified Bradyrhizobium TaxID=2631580 RepID=UPI0028E2C491|nr:MULTISPECIES: hypothetical protein [unclassified Bradyrhizobium]
MADLFAASIGGLAGGALVWHFKEKFVSWWHGAETYVQMLKAEAAAIEAKAAALKAVVSK